MRSRDFTEDAPGRLISQSGPCGKYLAYVPNPLPPTIDFGIETIHLLSRADQALGELKGVGQMLPNPNLLIGPFIRREAVSSSRIEGTVTNFEQLLLFEAHEDHGDHADDHREVMNYMVALRYGLDRLSTLPVSLRLMKEVHERLLAGVRGAEKTPGEFRSIQNMIGRQGQRPSDARFVPPPVEEMKKSLSDLETYVGYPSRFPTLVDLALVHYQFETIHPFLDGNGRLGRLLISLLLCERRCLAQPLLYLSSYLEDHRDEYMDNLLAVSQKGDWISWINFFLQGVAVQSNTAIQRCNELLTLWNHYKRIMQESTSSSYILRLIDMLFDRPSTTITQASEFLGITFRAAQLNIEKLEKRGILAEVTGKDRNRIYLALGIIEVIQKDENTNTNRDP